LQVFAIGVFVLAEQRSKVIYKGVKSPRCPYTPRAFSMRTQGIPCWFAGWCLFQDHSGCGVGCEKYLPDCDAEAARVNLLMGQAKELRRG
jgi:hypothetical protein